MKIYVASSWRNEARQQAVVRALRDRAHDVYDFREPVKGNRGFGWKQVTDDPTALTDPKKFRDLVLSSKIATDAFTLDMNALRSSDACVLVLPCGRSAHLELGWATGAGKKTIVLLDDPISEPELMYLACDAICVTLEEVATKLNGGIS